ncbi:NBR1-Ig-like domain-containing protein [Saccharomonospora iraqiensis]|uniref:NBR1-Ig-like domain-containing protein n=1 Tax=Saccharomonospora iraqiensis TaxID=52698 RepID=UPI00022E039F|nr:NBR1-Ig-like domain-containing protein [Saccharomonospora iraqiensis]
MAVPGGTSRPPALDEFIAGLRRLRERAGQPSFRRMAARSGAVSHATLHLTITGHRLQPWETVREFVRACGGDEDEWHAHWEHTRAALSGDEAPVPGDPLAPSEHGAATATTTGTDTDIESADRHHIPEVGGAEVEDATPDVPPPRTPAEVDHVTGTTVAPARRWRSRRVLVPLGAGVCAAVAAAGFVWLGPTDSWPTGTGPVDDGPAGTGGYAPALQRGDASFFVGDVTIPDGTVVRPGQQFVKTWRIRNTGSVHWRDRYLQRIDLPIGSNDCRTAERVPINDTAPHQDVLISVDVRAPASAPAYCKVHWKMVDDSGRVLLPGYRPVFFEVRVRAE